ncbi:MAG TPA: aminodeoxychorismate/anthranilate synthase component II [Thermoanaerobaculaceae bacterium]|nr:aminodeoxychorismate/anthranilate synthase component II [Thermoanaerobaculaceae bacterium]
MIVIIDSSDCFTFNLVQYVRELAAGVPLRVVRNDEVPAAEIVSWRPRAVVLADGPGRPEQAGMCVDLVRLAAAIPLLGVCLGHEAVALAYGAQVIQAPQPHHARTSEIFHNGQGIFAGLPDSFIAARFHALLVKRDTLPGELLVTAWTRNGLIMGLQHRERPHFGVQFHPESHLTHTGKRLIGSFRALSGLPGR